MPAPTLIACHECDLVQRAAPLARGAACCVRCGAILHRSRRDSLDRTLAFTLAAAVLFVLANAFPLVGIEVQGQRSAATLFGAARALYHQDMGIIAALVFLTTILVPALELAAMCYMLLPLHLGRRPAGLAHVFRLVQAIEPWGMVEVFVLGVLVSLVKLAHLAAVVPGIALWSFGGVILLLAAAATSYDPRELWRRAETAR